MSGLRMVILVFMVLDGECKTCHHVPIPHNTHITLPLHLHSTSSSHLLESHLTFQPPYDVKEWNLSLGWSTVTHTDHAKANNYAHFKNITLQVWSDHLVVKETRMGEAESVLLLRHNCSFTLDYFPDLSLAVKCFNHQQNDCGNVGFCWDECQMIRVPPNHRPLTLHHQTTTSTTKGKEGENNHLLDHNLHHYLLSTSFLHHAPRHQNTSWGLNVEIIPNSQNNNKTAQNINNSAARNDIKTTQTTFKKTQNNANKIKKDSNKTQNKKNVTKKNDNKTTQNITTAGQDYTKTTRACSIFFFHIPGHTRAENAMGISCNTSTDGGAVEKQNTFNTNTNGGAVAKGNHSNTNKTADGDAVAKEKTQWTTVDLWPVANQSIFHSPSSSSYLQERSLKIEVGLTHIQVTETTGGKNTVLLYHQCSAPLQHFPDLVLHAAIISILVMTTQQYLRVLEEMQLDGRRPSTPFNDDVLHIRHSKLLPIIIQLHLQTLAKLTLHEYGKRADNLMSNYAGGAHRGPTQHTNATIAKIPTSTTGPPPLTHT
ncbi:hypothetical protein Pmani_001017 [Petrolisthes manimaculis]|uniref:Uncharacterized protein n=1 Tax=Petrolisthes manimaculis TaxID=1843537 RepID=A0AAE1QL93_9EUCA|nr:hypothetical protein Pmani_001017 [Petrolisthes manimaculis]